MFCARRPAPGRGSPGRDRWRRSSGPGHAQVAARSPRVRPGMPPRDARATPAHVAHHRKGTAEAHRCLSPSIPCRSQPPLGTVIRRPVQPLAEQRLHLRLGNLTIDAHRRPPAPHPATRRIALRGVVIRQRLSTPTHNIPRRDLPRQIRKAVAGLQHMNGHQRANSPPGTSVTATTDMPAMRIGLIFKGIGLPTTT